MPLACGQPGMNSGPDAAQSPQFIGLRGFASWTREAPTRQPTVRRVGPALAVSPFVPYDTSIGQKDVRELRMFMACQPRPTHANC